MEIRNVGRLSTLLFIFLALSISGCASKPSWQTKYDKAMSDARAKHESEKYKQAKKSYLEATEINPTRAEPWVQLANIEFAHKNYGQAISMAGEALQREPSDRKSKEEAQAILVASGLRVTISGLERMHDGSKLKSATRDDARELAEKMRAVLGEDVIASEKPESEPKKPAARPRNTTRPPAKKANSNDAKNKAKDSDSGANYSNPFEFLPQN